jgi:thiol reductant ABC exporter CydD subunit
VRPLDPRLLKEVAPARWGVVTTAGLSAARAAVIVAQALLLARVLAGGFDGRLHIVALTWLGISLLLRGVLAAVQDHVSRRVSVAVREQLRARLTRHVLRLGPAWLSGRTTGEIGTLLGPGVESLDGYFGQYLPQLVLSLAVPGAVLVALARTDWQSGVILGFCLPLLPLFLALVGMHTRAQTANQFRRLAQLGGHFLDVVVGLPTLRVFGRAQAQVPVLRRITDEHRHATTRMLRSAFLSAFVLELTATLSIAVLAVSVGFRLLSGELPLEAALAVLVLAPEAFLPLRAVGGAFHAAQDGAGAAEAALDVLALPVPEQRGRQRATGSGFALREVSVVRGGRAPSLHGITLVVGEGEQVALLGPSGAGKSTVLDVVLGLVEVTSGVVELGGRDLREVDLEDWRAGIAWVPQRPTLFQGSVLDNIALARPGATRQQVRAAAREANAEEFIDALPRGFDTPLGELGSGLSVGQQRRIAVARAFLRDAPRVLLDEPTADLDAVSEAAVAEALDRLCEGRTVLMATHRREALLPGMRLVQMRSAELVGA